MSEIEQIIEILKRINQRLERMADNEKERGATVCSMLDRINWETHKTTQNLEYIKDTFGG